MLRRWVGLIAGRVQLAASIAAMDGLAGRKCQQLGVPQLLLQPTPATEPAAAQLRCMHVPRTLRIYLFFKGFCTQHTGAARTSPKLNNICAPWGTALVSQQLGETVHPALLDASCACSCTLSSSRCGGPMAVQSHHPLLPCTSAHSTSQLTTPPTSFPPPR